MKKAFNEIVRRDLIRVGAAYLAASWVLLQIADVLIDFIGAPDWTGKLLLMILASGFPLVLIFTWIYDFTKKDIVGSKASESNVFSAGFTAKIVGSVLVLTTLMAFVANQWLFSEGLPALSSESITASAPLDASVAVLPFDNISNDPNNDPFTIGIHDDLITQISKISSLKTISRASVLPYKERTKSLPQIAQELGVATLLEGSAQWANDIVRINVRLVDASTNQQLWAEQYQRQMTTGNIFSIQSEIVKAIAEALKATLSEDEKFAIEKVPTENLAALKAYFLGRQSMAQRSAIRLQEAIDFFKQAIELDPGFALAYVGLADGYQLQEDSGGLSRDEMFKLTEPAIEKALELDSNLGPAYNSLGGLRVTQGNYADAESLYLKSLELSPNYSTTYLWYGLMLLDLGRIEEAITMHRRGIERDPLSPQLIENLGYALEYQGRFAEALKEFQSLIKIDSTFASAFSAVGNIYWMVSGELNQAVACHSKGVELDPGTRLAKTYLGLLYLDLGAVDQAELWISDALQLAPDSLETLSAMAMLEWYRGNYDEALESAAEVQNINPYYPDARLLQTLSLAMLRNNDLAEGEADDARERYEESNPELLGDTDPVIGFQNFQRAIDLALVLKHTGETERAELLLDRSMAYIETGKIPRLGFVGFGIADVQIHAQRGDQKRALTALRLAIDKGWRGFWWYYLKNNPNLESLQASAEFQTMVEEVEAFMTGQQATLSQEVKCLNSE